MDFYLVLFSGITRVDKLERETVVLCLFVSTVCVHFFLLL